MPKFDNLRADPNFALACKRLAPMLKMKMAVSWPNENDSDENYKINCVYCLNPNTGFVYWSDKVHKSEEEFLTMFPKGTTVNIGLTDLQDEIRAGKVAKFNKSKASRMEDYARKMLGMSIKNPAVTESKKLMEGGNVFKTEEGPLTQRINRADIKPTLSFLEKVTGLPLIDNILGSVGKKASSGDIDVAVDPDTTTKDALVMQLMKWVQATHAGDKPRLWVAKSGDSVHFRTPIAGKEKNGFVQTDFMFGPPDWMKFSMASAGDKSQYSGMERNVLLASIAKARGAKWSYKHGLVNRETNETITKDPQRIAHFLLGKGSDPDELSSVESILHKISSDPYYLDLIADAKEAFAKNGKTI